MKLVLSLMSVVLMAVMAQAHALEAPIPHYDHILVIIDENHSYNQLMTGAQTPNIQRLAKTYGFASNFFAEVHPSEANYIAILGGSTFGIHDDDAFYCKPGTIDRYCTKSNQPDYVDHTLHGRSLIDQLNEKGLTWKAYMESIPRPGSDIIRYPDPQARIAGLPEGLYAVKHNGFMSFSIVQSDPKRADKIVGFDQLEHDLATNQIPNYAHIVPNQCNDMHGIEGDDVPEDCTKDNEAGRIARGDAVLGRLVAMIQAAPFWSEASNSAIIITFDEDGKPRNPADPQGCCGTEFGSKANFGGGHIPTIIITNHGVRGVVDPTPYNHYSLLRTTEQAFGINEYLNFANATDAGVTTLSTLFAVPTRSAQ